MDVQPKDLTEEIKRLQRCVNDLVSVLALPAMWSGREPSQIVHALLGAMLRMLQLDFVYVGLKETGGHAAIEMVRFAQSQQQTPPSREIGDVFKRLRGTAPQEWPRLLRIPLENRDITIVPLGLGLQGEIGVLVAGSERGDFPRQTEELILSVAANQASIGLHEAWLRSEQKRVASELDRRVAQRTTELAEANEELRKEIADRKHAEQDLRTSEEKHRVIIEAANDVVVSMDESGAILFANPVTRRVFGYDPVEVLGQPMTMLMPEMMRKLHQDGFKRYLATGKRHLNWHGVEVTAQHKDGREFPVEVSFGQLTNNEHKVFTGFIRDISERKQAEEMRAARARQIAVRADVSLAFGREESLKTILGECSEAIVRHLDAAFARIWTLSDDGKMLELRASAGMYTHLDGTHSHIPMGQFKIGMIAQERKPHLTNDVLNDPRISDRAWAEKEGMVSFAGYPLSVGDRTIGVLAMFSRKPVTPETTETLASGADLIAQAIERKHAEDKLRDSERSLHQSQIELARVSRLTTMGELAASIAHEVNQPLTAVINNGSACLRLLASRSLEPEVLRRALEGIVADGTRASAVLARIRAFIKKEPAEQGPLDLNEVIQDVLALAGRELDDNQVSIDRQLTKDLPPVLADRIQLQQVLLNLIMNGIEALTAVTDRPRLLWVQSRIDESGDVLVAVSDSGTGFGSEMDRVFAPFFTTKPKGMGMGLSISRSLVESHGGRLWATPNSPHGAVFSFTLPAIGGSPS